MAALAERLEEAAVRIDLDHADIARVLAANPRTVSRWLNKESTPRRESRERLLELLAVLERLSGTLNSQAAHDWLFTPNPSLDHHKPVDLLRDGSFRQVLAAIDALAEGVFV
jgi:putative toxin-antitoxin system antitoxin component (TIGR02293 family)